MLLLQGITCITGRTRGVQLSQALVDGMGCEPFDASDDLCEGLVLQCGGEEMYVVGHNDEGVEVEGLVVLGQECLGDGVSEARALEPVVLRGVVIELFDTVVDGGVVGGGVLFSEGGYLLEESLRQCAAETEGDELCAVWLVPVWEFGAGDVYMLFFVYEGGRVWGVFLRHGFLWLFDFISL